MSKTQTSAASTAIATRAARTSKGKNAGALAALAKTITETTPAVATPPVAAPAPAPVAPVVVSAPVKPLGIAYTMATVRPASGSALAAHSHVFLTHSGMFAGKPVPSAIVREVMGDVAYAYHTREQNFTTVGDSKDDKGATVRGGVILTERGQNTFGKRKQNLELVSAFENVLVRGEHDERTGNKNASLIRKIA